MLHLQERNILEGKLIIWNLMNHLDSSNLLRILLLEVVDLHLHSSSLASIKYNQFESWLLCLGCRYLEGTPSLS